MELGPGPSGLRALVPREEEAAGLEGSAAVEAEDSRREDSVLRRVGSERPPPEEGSVHSSNNKAVVALSEVIIIVYFLTISGRSRISVRGPDTLVVGKGVANNDCQNPPPQKKTV